MSVPRDLLPNTLTEYEARFRDNFDLRGRGEDTVVILPCPFCASRDWLEVEIVEFCHSTSPIYCVECGRSARFEHGQDDYGVEKMELVHVAGPTPPPWMRLRTEASEPATPQTVIPDEAPVEGPVLPDLKSPKGLYRGGNNL